MKLKKYLIIFTIAMVLILIYLLIFTPLFSTKNFVPEIKEIKNIELKEINSDSLSLVITSLAENKNNFSVDIDKIYLNIVYKTDTLGNAVKSGKISLKPKDSTDVIFDINLNTLKVVKLFKEELDSIELNLMGKISVNLLGINFPLYVNIPFKFSLKNNLYKTVERDANSDKIITVQQGRLIELRLNESLVEVNFLLKKPIRYSIYAYRLSILDFY